MSLATRDRPLVVHMVHRFDVGGMENGVVNLINRLPEAFADHCVVALTTSEPNFVGRLSRSDVRVLALNRRPGPLLAFLPDLYRLFRQMRPDIVHTRNVGTLEAQVAAWAAHVPVRIHGEHGWDVADLGEGNRRALTVRRIVRPLVHRQIALSAPTHRYLVERVGVDPDRVTNICNGVDTDVFSPVADRLPIRARIAESAPAARTVLAADAFVICAVGRLAAVKNLPLLLDALKIVIERNADFARTARLAIVGDGPERGALEARIAALDLSRRTWLAGGRADVSDCLRASDLLCLPSLTEGISNSILEAMASGLPVVATDVGGNPELVVNGETGTLVPSGDAVFLAEAIEKYFSDSARRHRTGILARQRAVTQFSLDGMVSRYHRVYSDELVRAGWSDLPPFEAAHVST